MTGLDLNCAYAEDYRDNDVGSVRMTCRVEQGTVINVILRVEGDGEEGLTYAPFAVCQTGLVDEANVVEKRPKGREYRSTAVIEHIYADRPLVRLRLANGAAMYLDRADRRFVLADAFRFDARRPGFNGEDLAQVAQVLQALAQMAAVIDTRARLWDHAVTDELARARRGSDHVTLGDPEAPHYVVVPYQGRISSVAVRGLTQRSSVDASFHGGPGVTFWGRSLPEHHAALAEIASAFSAPRRDGGGSSPASSG